MLAKLTARGFALTLSVLLFSFTVFGQKVVTGKVTGPDNQPLVGATISVKGTTVATTTSSSGDFSITVPGGRSVLVFTSVGFEEQQINIGSATNFAVSLKEKVSSLNEIVVTGYTAQKKKDITGSVAVVNIKDMRQMPAGTGEEALQGRASGVNIITSGQPGGASDIRIRGITTFGNNQPLVIIDGVPGDLHNINVADVESMQVLKDAAAAIYGAQGANGAIIITTKRGKAGRAKVSYDAYYGVTTTGKGYDMANPTEESNAIFQQLRNSGLNPGDATWGNKQFGYGANPVIPDYLQVLSYKNPTTNQPTNAGYTLCNCALDSIVDMRFYNINSNQITKANKTGTNWYKEITRNAPTQSHNISVSAGSDKSSYYFSLGYLNQQGIAKYQYNKRYSVRANTQFNIKNNIRVGENAYLFYQQNPRYGNQGEGSPFSMVFREDPIIPIYDEAGNFAGTKSQDLGNAQNPFANLYRTKDNRTNSWNMAGNVFAEVDILRHITVRTSFGGSINNSYNYNFNYVAYENAEGNTGINSFSEGASYGSNWTWTNTATYSNEFGNHNVKLLVGTEAKNNYYRYVGATRSNYFSENPDYWTIGTGTGTQSNSGGAGQWTSMSIIGKLEYAYAGKYLLNASLRRDAVSVFAPGARVGYFPAASVAWRVSQENFMKTVSLVNDLKLRYSWGKLGTFGNVPATNPYNLYASPSDRSAYDINGNSFSPFSGFFKAYLGNPNTSWEGDIISNVGLDATILNNKLDFTIEWYKKKVSGLLFQPSSSVLYDVVVIGDPQLPYVNIADNQSTGIDFNATYHGKVSKDFRFDVTGMVTTYKSKILSVPGSGYFEPGSIRNVTLQRNMEGHPYGTFFGYQVVGLFKDADDVTKSPKQDDAQPGVFKFKDVNGDGKINADDRTIIGNPNPDFTYGLNISLGYKNFDFSAFFFGSHGNDIYNQTLYYTDFPDFFKGAIRREAALNSWTATNTNTNIPVFRTKGGFSTDQSTNSYFVSKGSYLRARQIQIGYTLPNTILSKVGIDNFRIYVQGTNLFTITKYKGLDPELQTPPDSNGNIANIGAFGIDQGNYPHTPAFLFGVNVNF
ncbi:MAG: TonB-dependent receptor [Bacteroidetes bacterium]|nr:TonB-dependent receptor [Bacteroidota bacterium]MBS1609406.1 TonB-dependent receptor [Bacteroidota bacterium]